MNKQKLYDRQYQLAKLKIQEDWTDWLPSKESLNKWVDIAQTGLDIASIPASFVPGLNLAVSGAQALSAGIDVAQGQGEEAAWRGGIAALGVIPGVAGVASGAKAARAAKAVDAAVDISNASKVAKAGHAAVDAAKAADAAVDAAKAADAAGDLVGAAKAADEAGQALKFANSASSKSPSLAQRARTARSGAEPMPGTREVPGGATRPRPGTTRDVGRTPPSTPKTTPPPRTPDVTPRPRPGTPQPAPRTLPTPKPGSPKVNIGKQIITAIAKPGVGTGLATGLATGLTVSRLTGSGGTTTTATNTLPPVGGSGESKPETVKGDRVLTDVALSRLLQMDPGEVTGYEKSQVNLHKGRAGEQFLPTFYMTPSQIANLRRSTQAQRAAIPTYESYDGEMNNSILKNKVKFAVNQYLRSKHGQELNDHLNDVRKTLKTE